MTAATRSVGGSPLAGIHVAAIGPQSGCTTRLTIAFIVAAGLGIAGPGIAQTTSAAMSKDAYTIAKNNARTQFNADKRGCASVDGNAKDVCLAEAKGKEKVAGADAEEAYESTPRTRENARIARAQANHDVAVAKCDVLSGPARDSCIGNAKAQLGRSQAAMLSARL